jgi:ribonuclease HII
LKKDWNKVLQDIKSSNKKYIIGVDEVGTGSLIGDVWVVAFLAEKDWDYPGLNDSKNLTAKKRENIYEDMFQQNGNVQFCSAVVKQVDIDNIGLGIALKNGYKVAIDLLLFESDLTTEDYNIVIDGIHKVEGIDHYSLPIADSLIKQVAAASVLAKVARDAYVVNELDKLYPQYDWKTNKGYGTAAHKTAIKLYGLSPLHRTSFKIK